MLASPSSGNIAQYGNEGTPIGSGDINQYGAQGPQYGQGGTDQYGNEGGTYGDAGQEGLMGGIEREARDRLGNDDTQR